MHFALPKMTGRNDNQAESVPSTPPLLADGRGEVKLAYDFGSFGIEKRPESATNLKHRRGTNTWPRSLKFFLIGVSVGVAISSIVASILPLFPARNENTTAALQFSMNSTSHVKLHMVTIADENFATNYGVYFDKMQIYAARWGYMWAVLQVEDYEEDVCPNIPPMYKGLCMVADYMKRSTVEGDIVVFFDADYVPYRHHRSLEKWADALRHPSKASDSKLVSEQMPFDFVIYDRNFLDEIASGSYFARSSPRMISFLNEWSQYHYRQPPGFSSADNGSMHIHLLRWLGIEPEEGGRCGSKYNSLKAGVDNLQPYHDFLKCCRESLPIGKHRSEQLSVWIVGTVDPWAVDGIRETKPKEAKMAAIFHHGIKIFIKASLVKNGSTNTG